MSESAKYKIIEALGAGGMGKVYLADHALLKRPTAVKILSGEEAKATRGSIVDTGRLCSAKTRSGVAHEVSQQDQGHRVLTAPARGSRETDGNKPTAAGAALVFLDANGHELALTIDELEQITMDVANGSLEKERLSLLFEAAIRPVS